MANGIKPPSQHSNPPGVEILVDSSFLIALSIPSDEHHRAANSALGALRPYTPHFLIYNIVIPETVIKIMKRERVSARIAIKRYQKVLDRLRPNVAHGGLEIKQETLFQRLIELSRKRLIRDLDCNDFLIVAEGMRVNALIITCDKSMYERGTKIYKGKVFFISDRIKQLPSQIPQLLREIQKRAT